MDFCLPAAAYLPGSGSSMLVRRCKSNKNKHEFYESTNILCLASKRRGFGTEPVKKEKSNDTKKLKESMHSAPESSRLYSGKAKSRTQQAPQLTGGINRKSRDAVLDQEFMEKLEAVRRSVLEQKNAEEDKLNQPIDYDAPVESEQRTIGLGTKLGVGAAVLVFGLVFAFGDFLPNGSVGPSKDATVVEKKLSEKQKATLETQLQQFEATLRESPKDPIALEGAAVTLVELGKYERASSLLDKLTKERPNNVDAYRLLGEVKYELKDYEGSASAYRSSLSASDSIDFEVLRGLTNSLLADKKPKEAVQLLLSSREQLNGESFKGSDISVDTNGNVEKKIQNIDPIQVDLLLGKAYSNWGHISDAVAVYDQLISEHPDDFRGYLAKVVFTGGCTQPGTIRLDEGERRSYSVLDCESKQEAILPSVLYIEKILRRKPFLIKSLENVMQRFLQSLEPFEGNGRKKLAIFTALALETVFQDNLVAKGLVLSFITDFFK